MKCIHRRYCAVAGKKAIQSKLKQDCFFSRVRGWKGCNLRLEPFEIFPFFKGVLTASFFISDIVSLPGGVELLIMKCMLHSSLQLMLDTFFFFYFVQDYETFFG